MDKKMMDTIKEGYKKTEVGMIPKDWEVKKIGEICGFVVPGRNKPKEFKGDIPWITTPDIEGNVVSISKQGLFITKEQAKNIGSKIVLKDSVIMSCVGDLGLVAIAGRDIVINQQLHAFLPNINSVHTYLQYALSTQRHQMESMATKTAVPYLNKENCNSIQIPLPPTLVEQKAIATALSDMDELIQSLDKLIAKKRAIKQGTMQRLLKSPAEGGQRLPGFSGEWEVKKLNDILYTNKRITYGIVQPGEYQSNGVFMIRSQDYTKGWNNIDTIMKVDPKIDAPYERSRVAFGDLIITVVGANIGRIEVVPEQLDGANISRSVARISIDKSENNHIYCFYMLQSRQKDLVQGNQVGGAQPVINLKDLEEFQIPLPPTLAEQKAIAQILSDMDQEIEVLEQKREKYKAIKQGMMQELLTGKKRLV